MEAGVCQEDQKSPLLLGLEFRLRGLRTLGVVPGPNTSHRMERLPGTGRLMRPGPTCLPAPRPLAPGQA